MTETSSPSAQRTVALLALVLAAVVLVIDARVILGGKAWNDIAYHTQVAPPRYAAAVSVQRGELPAWWDGTGLGVPLLGEPTHGALYPLHWIAGTPRALELVLLLHLWFAALGVALWARRLGASDIAALVAGVLAATTGVLATAALRGTLPALAYVPWIAWAATTRRHALAGLFIGLAGLAGPLGVIIDGAALALVIAPRDRRLYGAIGCGLAIAALQWIPAALAIPHMAGATLRGLPLARVVELVAPLRSPTASVPTVFVGAALLGLAAVSRPGRGIVGYAAALAIAAAVVGRGGWPAWLGGFEIHLGVLALVAAAHAATSIDALFAADTEVLARRRRALLALVGAAFFTLIAVGALGALRGRVEGLEREAIDHALRDGAIATACAIAAAALAWRVRVRMTPLVVALLLVAPGVLAHPSLMPVVDRDVVDEPAPWVEKALASPAPVRVFRPVRLFENVHDTTPPTLDGELATFAGASGSLWGIDAARSEDPARLAEHDQTWLAAASAGGQLLARYGISLAILPLANLEGHTVTELGRRRSWALVRYKASPPASVIYEWIFAHDTATELRRLFPPGSVRGLPAGLVVLHGDGAENQDEPSVPEPCTIERWTDGAIDLTCTAHGDAYAVIASSPFPGWTVTVNGEARAWLTADVLSRAVAIRAGESRVRWRYQPPGMYAAIVVMALGLLGSIALRLRRRS